MRRAAVFAALLLAVLAGALRGYWGLGSGSVSSAGGLACSVKASCGAGEVAVFRMSSLANAHAGTATGSGYGDVVCCSGPAGLSASCSGSYATVLRLSATDNAHVASSDVSYTTQACLSATGTAMNCQYSSSCGSGYACLATISGSTNAHVADCSGGGYPTKVCCAAGAAPAVGGIAEPPDVAAASGSSSPPYAALAGAAGAAVLLLMAGGWHAKRRRQDARSR
jgi:hypothetical protein